MPIANPLTNGGSIFSASDGGGGNWDDSTTQRRSPGATGAPPVGSGDLTGAHNTPLHCSALVLAALVVVFGMYFLGFRFTAAAGVGK